ncbi:hypothetical protein WI73_14140 [Burkholderia ubonensis]|uniref:Solute-binding protein family 5 domain-containing protein n=1 Tax=Burkholderia ubonensis TaxID=101571 RepID=A0A102K7L8_9BURK|nr:ABC transporter substrate-binding protein [Burkholderia ubonensis]KUZ70210.1 hypothetical protein WI35_17070 [Burkholderia ubonensis]KUZ82561.1 hypothetical protein WI36_03540 [Burkholderia ubonensis]KUZ88802.1 hypothetical protein WI38_18715 [Burkholderia ubonensis]KUZ90137.1 hypothetical protein WI39_19580 [Burkholderia ubonensis]KUZ94285.1 hypothetical protein WI40_19285 [Burkholderia ubonensis]
MRHILTFLIGLALLVQGAMAATPKDMLVVVKNIEDIVSLDPAESYELTSMELGANLYQNLVQYDPVDPNNVRPGLAASWSVGRDGRSIDFVLKPGAKFASGNPVRPEDVVYSFRRVVQLNKAPAFILTQLGWTSANLAQMVRRTGAQTLSVAWQGEFGAAFVLNLLASRPASIVDQATVAAHDSRGDLGNAWLQAHSAGSGSYVLKLYKPKEAVILDANPLSPAGSPAIRTVLMKNMAEAATQRLALESGDADVARDLGPDQIAALQGKPGVRVQTSPQAIVHFVSLNLKHAKLRNPAIWQALRYLVDYDGIAGHLQKGQLTVHQAFLPAGFAGALNDNPYRFDPQKARTILERAGVRNLSIDLDVINTPRFLDIAQSMQASFAKGGIRLNLLPGTGAQVITRYRARAHEAMLLYWGADYFDPHANAKSFAYNVDNGDANPQSTTAWRNAWLVPELSQRTTAALQTRDPVRRAADYQAIQREVQRNAPIVVTFQELSQVAVRGNVKGFSVGLTPDLIQYAGVSK